MPIRLLKIIRLAINNYQTEFVFVNFLLRMIAAKVDDFKKYFNCLSSGIHLHLKHLEKAHMMLN